MKVDLQTCYTIYHKQPYSPHSLKPPFPDLTVPYMSICTSCLFSDIIWALCSQYGYTNPNPVTLLHPVNHIIRTAYGFLQSVTGHGVSKEQTLHTWANSPMVARTLMTTPGLGSGSFSFRMRAYVKTQVRIGELIQHRNNIYSNSRKVGRAKVRPRLQIKYRIYINI